VACWTSSEGAAAAISTGLEKGRRNFVEPAIFRMLFLLNALSPARTESVMCKK
jgi:hypothetical protein